MLTIRLRYLSSDEPLTDLSSPRLELVKRFKPLSARYWTKALLLGWASHLLIVEWWKETLW